MRIRTYKDTCKDIPKTYKDTFIEDLLDARRTAHYI